VLTKTKDPYNKNELTLTFTPFGAQAFQYYSGRVADNTKKHHRYLERFTDDEKAAIQRFLIQVDEILDEME
jgi:coproporphyrinogen III oxidase-like Fe-S oxidoreductase